MASQTQMESIRDQMKEIRDKAQKKMSRPYDPNQGMHAGFLVFFLTFFVMHYSMQYHFIILLSYLVLQIKTFVLKIKVNDD